MLAPVVPMKFAKTAPIPKNIVLARGVFLISPEIQIPPETVKRAPNKTKKEI